MARYEQEINDAELNDRQVVDSLNFDGTGFSGGLNDRAGTTGNVQDIHASQEKELIDRYGGGQGGYSRSQEKNQEIGDEFANPDKQMEEATLKIQTMYRGHKARQEVNEKKKNSNASKK